MEVNLNDIIDAIDEVNGEEDQFYYDPATGKIIYDADEPEDGWIMLPTHDEIDDYGTMKRFIERIDDPGKKIWFENAIHGKGAFRRFRSTLERFKMENEWYDFLDKTHEEIAMEWCEDHGLTYSLHNTNKEEDDSFDEDAFMHGDDYSKQEETPKEDTVITEYRFVPVTNDNYMRLLFMKKDVMNLIAVEEGNKVRYTEDDAQEELEEELGNGMKMYAVSQSGRFIGYISIVEEYGQSEIREMYVVKDKRRQKAGSFLLQHASKAAESRIVISVHPLNTEYTAFIKKLGYDHLVRIVYAEGE